MSVERRALSVEGIVPGEAWRISTLDAGRSLLRWSLLAVLLLGTSAAPAPAGTCDGRLAIWFQPGVDDCDAFLADWPALSRELAARGIRWVRIDTTSLTNTVNARAHGIKRLPAFCYRGRWVQGYTGLAPLLAQLGLASLATPPATTPPATTPPVTGPRGETPTYTPPVGQSAPEALDLQTFQTAIGRLEEDQQRQDDQLAESAEWRAESGEQLAGHTAQLSALSSQLSTLRQRSDARWAATEAGLKALAHVQQQLASLESSVQSPESSAAAQPPGRSTAQTLPENKAFQRREAPEPAKQPGKWLRFLARLGKLGLMVAAPEVAVPTVGLTAGLTVAGWIARRVWQRRTIEKTSAGRPEVRPADTFQPLAGPAISAESEPSQGAKSAVHGPPRPTGPGPWQRINPHEKRDDAGIKVRSADGGPVPERFPAGED